MFEIQVSGKETKEGGKKRGGYLIHQRFQITRYKRAFL